MDTIISWLISVEVLARDLYSDAIEYFGDDELLKSFLIILIEDESFHINLMNKALSFIEQRKIESVIALNDGTKESVERPLLSTQSKIHDKTLSKADFYAAMIEAEYSEWNSIFIYVLQNLSLYNKQFQYAASVIQNHENRIDGFFSKNVHSDSLLDIIHNFPTVWKKNMLVVDDNEANITILSRIFKNEFIIEIAVNGREALEKAKNNYFDIIISDIEMPVMTGLEFYASLSESDSEIDDHFLFMTGNENNLTETIKEKCRYILKPYTINSMKKKVTELIADL